MLQSTRKEAVRSNEELRKYGDWCMDLIQKGYESVDIGKLYGRIEALFQERPSDFLEQLAGLVRSQEFRQAMKWDDNLELLDAMVVLCETEKKCRETPTLEKAESFEQLLVLCRKTIFLLRRIELQMPQEDCRELLYYMKEWHFTANYLIVLLMQGDIWQKKYTGERLGKLLQQHGYPGEGRLITAWAAAV